VVAVVDFGTTKAKLAKVPVVGLAERKGRVKAVTVTDTKSATLLNTVREYVLPKSTVFTDEYNSYDGLSRMKEGYKHKRYSPCVQGVRQWRRSHQYH
jgi:transposase-like protein